MRGRSDHQKTRDHKQPKCRGGKYETGNIVLACYKCNTEKGKLTSEEYRAVLAFRRNVERTAFRFAGEQSKFVAERSGVRAVVWEPKFILLV